MAGGWNRRICARHRRIARDTLLLFLTSCGRDFTSQIMSHGFSEYVGSTLDSCSLFFYRSKIELIRCWSCSKEMLEMLWEQIFSEGVRKAFTYRPRQKKVWRQLNGEVSPFRFKWKILRGYFLRHTSYFSQ
jgi:hypothetical protein